MIKKILAAFLITMSLSFIHTSFAVAQEEGQLEPAQTIVAPDYYPRPVESANFLGQEHNYSVTFRGNGEAVVSARIVFSNLEEATMSAMTVRVPRVVPQDVMVYQISREPQCIRYRSYDQLTPSGQPNSAGITFEQNQLILPIKPIQPVCEEYQEPDFTQYWYGGNTYHKAQVTMGTDSIEITLPKLVKPNGSGSLIIYYRAVGYAKPDMYGAFNYTFETLKVEDRIRALQVGISTDSDLYLKEAKGKVDYQVTEAIQPAVGVDMAQKQGSFSSAQLDSYTQQIGYGTIVKSSSNLQPLDSYTVTGAFAESQWRLYGKQIAAGVAVILVILILLVLFIRIMIRKFTKHSSSSESGKQKGSSDNAVFAAKVAAVSFVSALLIGVYGVAIFFTASLIERTFSYYSGMVGFFAMLLLGIISFAVFALLLFGPALYVGIKQGFWRGAIVFAATVVWLKLFFLVLVMILFLFGYNRYDSYPPIYSVPMMRDQGVESSESSGVMMK